MLEIIECDSRVPAGRYGNYLHETCVPFKVRRPFTGEDLPRPERTDAVLLLGGYMGVHQEGDFPFLALLKQWIRAVLAAERPLLGICLGGQLLAEAAGGRVISNHRGERGMHPVNLTPAGRTDPLFTGFPPTFSAFEWHNDSFDLPPGAVHLAASATCPGQAFRVGQAWGLQFHPEVDETVVRTWAADTGAGPQPVEAYRRAEAVYTPLALTLLKNFLAQK